MRHENTGGPPGSRTGGLLPATEFVRNAIPFEVNTSFAKSNHAHCGGPALRGAGLQATIAGHPMEGSGRATRGAWHRDWRGVVGAVGRWPDSRAQRIATQDHLAYDRRG